MLTDKYLWNLTQNFNIYSDILTDIKVIQNEKIGSLCHVFREKYNRNTIYVRFQGTELCIKDILVDMFFFKKNLGNKMKVHAGVWSAVESIFNEILNILRQNISKKIIIFGHSLGAMMSKEFARKITKILCKKENIKIVTFGTAKTGNKKFAEYFNDFDMKEYIISSDPITWLPLRIMNYKHTNKIIKLKEWLWDGHHKYGLFV